MFPPKLLTGCGDWEKIRKEALHQPSENQGHVSPELLANCTMHLVLPHSMLFDVCCKFCGVWKLSGFIQWNGLTIIDRLQFA